jgi:hypothetical protein
MKSASVSERKGDVRSALITGQDVTLVGICQHLFPFR